MDWGEIIVSMIMQTAGISFSVHSGQFAEKYPCERLQKLIVESSYFILEKVMEFHFLISIWTLHWLMLILLERFCELQEGDILQTERNRLYSEWEKIMVPNDFISKSMKIIKLTIVKLLWRAWRGETHVYVSSNFPSKMLSFSSMICAPVIVAMLAIV